MPTGLSLHLGLNAVDPRHYQGWSGDLAGCENDARDMATIAKARGFTPTTLLTKKGHRRCGHRRHRQGRCHPARW